MAPRRWRKRATVQNTIVGSKVVKIRGKRSSGGLRNMEVGEGGKKAKKRV